MKKLMKALIFSGLVMVFSALLPVGAQAATLNVSVLDFFFQPQTITINAGDTVTWTNNGFAPHTTTSGTGCVSDGKWDSGTLGAVPFSRVFTTPGTYPYFCVFHCLSSGMTGTVIVNPVIFPAPAGQHVVTFPAITAPVIGSDRDTSKPIGIGALATGGTTLTIQVAISQYAVPMDIYAAFTVSTTPQTIVNIMPNLSFQNFTLQDILVALSSGQPPVGSVPWMSNVATTVNATLFTDLPVSGIPAGHYTAYLLVTPHGGSFSNFDLYQTDFNVGSM